MAFISRLVSVSLVAACCATAAAVQIDVPLLSSEPEIDGRISSQESGSAAKVDMTRLGGFDKPSQPTDVFVAASRTGLYVAFDAKETAMDGLVTSATRENGAVFDDDSVQVFLSAAREATANNYFHFAVNTAGVRYSNSAWDNEEVSGWKTAVSKSDGNWQAEIFIPLAAIKAPDELPYWRANFSRVRPVRQAEQEEISAWVNPGITLHNYNRFGFLSMPNLIPGSGNGSTTRSATAARTTTTVTTTTRQGVLPQL